MTKFRASLAAALAALFAANASAALPINVINRSGAAVVRLEIEHDGDYSCAARHRNRLLTRMLLSDTKLGDTPEAMGLSLHRLGLAMDVTETLDMTSLTLSGAPQSLLTMLGVIDATIGRAALPAKAIAREIAGLPMQDQRHSVSRTLDAATTPAQGAGEDQCPFTAETVASLRSKNWQAEYENQARQSAYSLVVVGDTSGINLPAYNQRLISSRGIPTPEQPVESDEFDTSKPPVLRRHSIVEHDSRAAEGFSKLYALEPARSPHSVVWRVSVPGRKYISPAIVERLASRLSLEVLAGIDGGSTNMQVSHRVLQGNNGGWIDISVMSGLQYAAEVSTRGSTALQAALRNPKIPLETANISLASMDNRAIAENLVEWEWNSLPTALSLEAINKAPPLVFYSVENKDRTSLWALLAGCVMLAGLFLLRRRMMQARR